jgi:hypothetical protein
MGANESMEVVEDRHLKVEIVKENGMKEGFEDKLHRQIKLKSKNCQVPKFELDAKAPYLAGKTSMGESSAVALRK